MLETYKKLIANQYDAAFATLGACIDQCPEANWNGKIANLAFCQVVFHTLFFADYYLGPNAESFRQQAFHRQSADFFRDYEELEDRPPKWLYDKSSIKTYLQFCRKKASEVIATETANSLSGSSGFKGRTFTRAELHVYNIRHIEHHAAQMSLRLRLDANVAIPWF
jgi:hypothetical protein